MGQKYVIVAGDGKRPATVTGQHLEKGSGQTLTAQGGMVAQYVLPRQDIGIPNYTQAWGKRVILDDSGKEVKIEHQVDVKDPKYKGQIKFLKWGDKDGYLINCRYIPGYNTLDIQYQELVLGYKVNENDPSSADAFFLRLQSGVNEYDESTNKYLVQMLKISNYNQDSSFKNPESFNWLFKEQNEEEVAELSTTTLNKKFQAGAIVNEAAEDNTGKKLNVLKGIVAKIYIEDEGKGEYELLLKLADQKPEDFLLEINNHKKAMSNLFEKFKSYNAIDLTKDGVVVAGQTKKEVILEDIDAKAGTQLEWMITNYLEPKVHDAMFTLTTISKTFK